MAERLRYRQTSDLVVVWLAAVVGFVVIIGVLGLVALKIADPDGDVDSTVEVIGSVITTMLGAVIGFIGGRAVGVNQGTADKDEGPR